MRKEPTKSVKFYFGSLVIIVTAITVLIMAYGLYLSLFVESTSNTARIIYLSVIALLLIAALITPTKMYYTDDYLIIKHIVGKTKIHKQNIISIEKSDDELIKKSIRLCGIGGFCGFTGFFYNSKMKTFILYATEMRNFITITTPRRTYVVSCYDRDEFLKAF